MSFNPADHHDDLLFVPLGGTNEIGMNLNLYHYQGKWLIVDLGIGFADDYLPGIEVVLPNIDFLDAIREDIIGLVLTHAHEDHMGALPYLWDEVNVPVYATPFTAAVLKRKMADEGVAGKMQIHQVQGGSSMELGPFALDLIELTHSIPEMQALAIRTEKGVIVHTGDWKLDPMPVVGPASDEAALRKYGDEGVLALVCDSTNVFVEGESGSEQDVYEELTSQIAQLKQGVIVSTFASNIARVESIVRAGHAAGRKIVLLGRSLHRVTTAAQESGYLSDITFLDEKTASGLPPEELMILCTGCQGEPRAALSRIVQGRHPVFRLRKGDTVIFSSRMIPGNESRIRWLYNRLASLGVEVITEKDAPIHVSGHPAREELERMYQLVRPRVAVPVHGEPAHISEHAAFARTMQVPEIVECANGVVACLASEEHPVGIVGYVPSGYLAVDGNTMLPVDSVVIRNRRRLKEAGVLTVSVVVDKDLVALSRPVISAPGCLDQKVDTDLIEELAEAVEEVIETEGRKKKTVGLEDKIRRALRRVLMRGLGKKPMMDIHLHRV